MKAFLKDLRLMAQLRLRHWKYVWGENGRLIGIGSLMLKTRNWMWNWKTEVQESEEEQ